MKFENNKCALLGFDSEGEHVAHVVVVEVEDLKALEA